MHQTGCDLNQLKCLWYIAAFSPNILQDIFPIIPQNILNSTEVYITNKTRY